MRRNIRGPSAHLLGMTTDAELIRAARSDPGAFRELYDRYAERVYRFHLARSRDADAAHDLTAETFAQAWLGRARFRDEAGGSAGPWLFGIARHLLSASVRRGRLERAATERLGLLERLDREAATVPPEESWLDALDEALAELPESQLEALRLRFDDDLPYDGLASSLGTTPQAARVRVHRGLSALRLRLASKESPR
jgi:RNA polymerase sigma-70 factor, ECF subfamily